MRSGGWHASCTYVSKEQGRGDHGPAPPPDRLAWPAVGLSAGDDCRHPAVFIAQRYRSGSRSLGAPGECAARGRQYRAGRRAVPRTAPGPGRAAPPEHPHRRPARGTRNAASRAGLAGPGAGRAPGTGNPHRRPHPVHCAESKLGNQRTAGGHCSNMEHPIVLFRNNSAAHLVVRRPRAGAGARTRGQPAAPGARRAGSGPARLRPARIRPGGARHRAPGRRPGRCPHRPARTGAPADLGAGRRAARTGARAARRNGPDPDGAERHGDPPGTQRRPTAAGRRGGMRRRPAARPAHLQRAAARHAQDPAPARPARQRPGADAARTGTRLARAPHRHRFRARPAAGAARHRRRDGADGLPCGAGSRHECRAPQRRPPLHGADGHRRHHPHARCDRRRLRPAGRSALAWRTAGHAGAGRHGGRTTAGLARPGGGLCLRAIFPLPAAAEASPINAILGANA
jgi:hypothetical protein